MTFRAKCRVPVFLWITFFSVLAGAQQISFTPSTLNFGNVNVGSSKTQAVLVKNTTKRRIGILQANVSGKGYTISGISCPVSLPAGESVSFNVTFTPPSAETDSGLVSLMTDNWWKKLRTESATSDLNVSGTGTDANPGKIAPNPASLSFGSVVIGYTKTLNETLTNSGTSSLTISAATAPGGGFSLSGLNLPLTLPAGQSTSFSVQFVPVSAGAVSGNIVITSNGSNPTLNIPVSGTGATPGTLSANPTSLSFGNVQVGNNASLSETFTNTGGSTVTISQTNVTGQAFSITGPSLPTTLAGGQSVTFTAKFAPAAAGSVNGTLAVVSDASNSPLNIPLSGTGTAPGQLSVSPGTLSFGDVVVNANAALNGSLSATGASVTVSSGSTDSGEFVLSGITLPKTIPAGQSATFTVTFTPNAAGNASASIAFLSNAAYSPTAESLTGVGLAPPPHSVNLSWNASQSQGVVGYNVYRAAQPGGPYSRVTMSLNADTTYTDDTVTAGQTYFYVAKGVDNNDVESGPSNEVQATIPSP